MKKILILFLFFGTSKTIAQEISNEKSNEISYGIVLGTNFYNFANNNTVDSFVKRTNAPAFIIGGYGEFNFTKNIGIKVDGIFYDKEFIYFSKNKIFTMKFIDISTNMKYDFGETYREGFYLVGGPKISMITNATSDTEDVRYHFKTLNIGIQAGCGWRLKEFIDVQLKLEYEVTPFFELDNGNNSKFIDAIVSANIDFSRIFSKKKE